MPEGARPAVFLDRDGIINDRRPLLVRQLHQFRFARGALDALRRLAATPYAVVVATNQPAVAWGWMPDEELERIHATMRRQVADAGGRIDAVYACTDAPGPEPTCRKPSPKMLLDAAADHHLDLTRSWMVGDNVKDVAAGRAAGCRTILANPTLRARLSRGVHQPHARARDLAGAVDLILADAEAEAPKA